MITLKDIRILLQKIGVSILVFAVPLAILGGGLFLLTRLLNH
jgi:hypothetical protein